MSKTPPPARPAAPRPKTEPPPTGSIRRAPVLTKPLTPEEAKRMAAALMERLKQ
jgi:hypothetical protein